MTAGMVVIAGIVTGVGGILLFMLVWQLLGFLWYATEVMKAELELKKHWLRKHRMRETGRG